MLLILGKSNVNQCICTVEGLVSLIFDVMSLQLIMKRRRKGPNTQPGLAREHLLDKYCDVQSPHFIQIGHILYLYITAGESSRTATARDIIRYKKS